MKPNDKAIEAALRATSDSCSAYQIQNALDAAFAAQFPPSEDYAGLVKKLRERARYDGWATEDVFSGDAADALEAVLAELKNEREAHKKCVDKRCKLIDEINLLRTERGARLAPVDDKALVEIAAREILIERRSLAAAIAAIRPHIEAAERERCAKIADKYEGEWHSDTADACARAIAAAIRSGK